MKCYYHPGIGTVAICKNCQRALCMDCAVDVGNGMACKNKCEEEVKAVNELLKRGQCAYQKAGSAYIGSAIMIGLLGLLFTGISILSLVLTDKKGLVFLFASGGHLYHRSFIECVEWTENQEN